MRILLAELAGAYGMPITRSAKKAWRQSLKRRARNLIRKNTMQRAEKAVRKLAQAGKGDEIKAALSAAFKALDKAAKTGVVKRNAAARKKARLVAFLRRTELGGKSQK